MSQKSNKKKVAIMFTDIANFTQMMSVNEKSSLDFLDTKKDELRKLVKIYKGKYVKDIGDGTLTYFPTPSNALDCALKLHYALSDFDKLEIRVGIHYGEMISVKGDIYGDSVNIASRLEHLSPAGGICISGELFNILPNKNQVKTDYIGLQSFKGVGRLIDVYAINDNKLKKANIEDYLTENIEVKYEKVPTVTLFPFNNKGDKKDEFFAYCMSTDIVSELGSSGKIKITTFEELEKYKKRNYKNTTICEKLGARYHIAGDFWKQKSHFNLSIKLFDNEKNKNIWMNSWTEEWDNFDIIKSKLTDNIFRLILGDFPSENLDVKTKEGNSKAQELFLKAKYIFHQRSTNQDYVKIEKLLLESIGLDKNYSEPHILFAEYYLVKNEYSNCLKFYESSLKISLKSKHDKNIATSLNGIGKTYYLNGKHEKALEYYNQALQIWKKLDNYTGLSDTLNLVGAINDYNGRFKEALKNYKQAYDGFIKVNDKNGACKTAFNISNVYCSMDETTHALKYQEISFKLSNETSNVVMQGYSYNLRGIIYSNAYQGQEAYEFFKKSLKIRKSLNDQEGISTLYRNIGVVYLQMGLLKQAIDYFNRSLLTCESIGYFLGIVECYQQLGRAYKTMGSYDESIKYYESALEEYNETENYNKISQTLNRIGNLYIKKSDYKKALDFFKKSKKINKNNNDNIGSTYSLMGEGKINYWLGNYDKALKLFLDCLEVANQYDIQKMKGDSKYFISQIYLNKNMYKDAMLNIDFAIDTVDNEKKLKSRLAKYYDCKGLIYKFRGNLDKAINMHEKALSISKEINDKHALRKYLSNIGLIYEEQASFEKAIDIYAKSLSIAKEMNEKRSICVSYCNIGYILEYQGAIDQALKYFRRALRLSEKIGYKAGIGGYSNNMAQIYIKKQQYNKAIPLLNNAVEILEKLGAVDCVFYIIARAFCYMKVKNNDKLSEELRNIEGALKKHGSLYDYRALWQLHCVYKKLSDYKKANQYLNAAEKSLKKRCKKIKTDNDVTYFLNTYDASSVLKSIQN